MKVFALIVIFGQVSGVAGPLPYDMAECRVRMQEISTEWDRDFIDKDLDHEEGFAIDGRKIHRSDMSTACVETDTKPTMGQPYP